MARTISLASVAWVATAPAAAASPLSLVEARAVGSDVRPQMALSACAAQTEKACEQGSPSAAPGGFQFPAGVAVDSNPASVHYGDVYVADLGNKRIQELTPDGRFVAMFGWDVNASKRASAAATQAERDVCTSSEVEMLGVTCAAAKPAGADVGRLPAPTSIAVDQRTGDLYIEEAVLGDYRMEKYTPDGVFLWMLGRHVNGVTGANICTRFDVISPGEHCRAGSAAPPRTREHGAFHFAQLHGGLVAVGGPGDHVYCGDEHRVQIFTRSGRWIRELSLLPYSAAPLSAVVALDVRSDGRIDVVYRSPEAAAGGEASDVIRTFDPHGRLIATTAVASRPGRAIELEGLALDAQDRLVVLALEPAAPDLARIGAVIEPGKGAPGGFFHLSADNAGGAAFSPDGRLYVAGTDEEAILLYTSVPSVILGSAGATSALRGWPAG